MAAFNLQVLLTLADRLSGPMQEPIRRLQQLQEHAERADRSMKMMQTGAGLMAGGGVLAAPFVAGAREAILFEDKLADTRKVMDELENHTLFQKMGRDLRLMSFDIPINAKGMTEIATFSAASKLEPTRQGVLQMTKDAAKMGVAFDIAAGDAGDQLAGMRSIFELTEKQVVKLGDAINYLGNNTSARARDMVNFLTRAGAVGKQVGLTAQQTAALADAFLVLKTPPEVAARAVSQALIPSLQTATRQGDKFAAAAKVIGMSAEAIEKGMQMDAQGTILDVLERVSKTSNKMGVLTDMFGVGFADDIAKLAGSLNVYKRALGLVADETKYAGSMEKEYQGRINTTATQLQLLWNGILNVGGALGDTYLPLIKMGVQTANTFAKTLYNLTQQHPILTRMITFTALGLALLTIALGAGIFALGLFGFAAANVGAGVTILKGYLASAKLYVLGLRNALITRITGGFIPSTVAQMRLFGGAATLNQIALQGLKQAFMQATRAAWAFIAPILANPITWLVVAVVALAGAFVYLWQTSHQFRAAIKAAFEPLKEAWAGVGLAWAQLTGVFGRDLPLDSQARKVSNWGNVWKGVIDFILYWAVYLTVSISLYVADIAMVFVNTWNGIITFLAGAGNIIKGLITGDMSIVQRGIQQVGDGIKTFWNNSLLGGMIKGVLNWGPAILEGFGAAMGELWSMAKEWGDIGKHWLQNLWDGIKSKFADLKSGVADLGWNVVEGITGGLVKNPNAKTAAAQTADQVTDTVKTKWDIHSPSRVFAGLGQYAMDGLAVGVSQGAAVADKAARTAIDGVSNTALQAAEQTRGALSDVVRQATQSGRVAGTALLTVAALTAPAAASGSGSLSAANTQTAAHRLFAPEGESEGGAMVTPVAVATLQTPPASAQTQGDGVSTSTGGVTITGNTFVFQMPEGSNQEQFAAFMQFLQSLQK